MATPLHDVYDAFLAKVEADDWMLTDDVEDVERDWLAILQSAAVHFRYPRVSLEYDVDTGYFTETLGQEEIQILANLMKLEWVKRCVATWDSIRQLYNDKEFSQANLLSKLNQTEENMRKECNILMDRYSRSQDYKPTILFAQMAGKG